MNVLSLFSGIGGLELGLERAGMTTVGQVEINPFCRQVLAKHWPDVPCHDDVRTAPSWWLSELRPPVDVIAGGFPCQPFSVAGLRKGIADERWGWPWMLDAVRRIRPRYVIAENVPTLIRDSGAFGRILCDLHELGFDAQWATIRASDVGAPHKRERVFIVAYPQVNDGCDAHESAPTRQVECESGGGGGGFGRPGWVPEPQVGRVADGLSRGLVYDQLFALGNAVVPQVAEFIGRQLMANIYREVADVQVV